MFKKLHLKLTLINTVVIGIILSIIFSGIYLFMKNDMIKESNKIMFSIGSEARSRIPRVLRQPNSNYFFVDTDGKGIYNFSANTSTSQEDMPKLVENVRKSDKDNGQIKVNGITYRYYKFFIFENFPMLRIVFYNTEFESQVLSRLLYTLLIVGFAAILLGYFSSLYLANKALIPINAAWDKQKAFVADASHELRTPLSVIQTNLDVVMSNQSETVSEQSKWLGYIKDESARMNKLVEDLLFLARSDSDEIKLDKKVFAFDILLKNTLESFLPIANLRNIKLISNIQPNILYNGDQHKIKQLIEILLDNAIKYNVENGSINVLLSSSYNNIELEISDTGVGIDKIHLDKIFERFYRVDASRAREQGGTGLGLSIAYSIIKEHDAKINVDSKLGQGTKFKISFPRQNRIGC